MKRSMDTWLKLHPMRKVKVRKEPLYWQVYYGGVLIDENNSIALLRHKWKGQKVIFKSVR
jgi:hypothetical protein